MNPRPSMGQQALVVIPTVAVSAFLGYLGMPPVPRTVAALGFGAVLIAGLAYYRRKNQL